MTSWCPCLLQELDCKSLWDTAVVVAPHWGSVDLSLDVGQEQASREGQS